MPPSAISFSIVLPITLLLVVSLPAGQSATSWDNKGGLCETGIRQSPINIESNDVQRITDAQPLVFINYNRTTLSVQVDDHSIKLTVTPSISRFATGVVAGGFRGYYMLDNIHFHWGTEHTFDGNRFPLEAHFVHYNSIYPNLNAALSDPGGVAVVGVVFSEGRKSHPIDKLIEGVEQLASTGAASVDLDLKPGELLPADTTKFFRYFGSLTTPPCSESVIWSIFKSKLTISPEQIAWFKKAPLTHGPISSNFRPVQDIGYREVQLWITSFRNKGFIRTTNNYLSLLLLSILNKL